jgi:hypothetical protein
VPLSVEHEVRCARLEVVAPTERDPRLRKPEINRKLHGHRDEDAGVGRIYGGAQDDGEDAAAVASLLEVRLEAVDDTGCVVHDDVDVLGFLVVGVWGVRVELDADVELCGERRSAGFGGLAGRAHLEGAREAELVLPGSEAAGDGVVHEGGVAAVVDIFVMKVLCLSGRILLLVSRLLLPLLPPPPLRSPVFICLRVVAASSIWCARRRPGECRVVCGALLGVGQHLVGANGSLEVPFALFALVVVDQDGLVGVVLQRQSALCLSDVIDGRVRRDAELLVVVCHIENQQDGQLVNVTMCRGGRRREEKGNRMHRERRKVFVLFRAFAR